MKTDQLARNQLSPAAYAWYLDYLGDMDRRDIDAYAARLSEDCVLYMNNEGPIAGKRAIVDKLGPYWQSFADLEHDLLNILGDDRCWMLEALNHYTRHDGRKVTARAVAITEREPDGLVTAVRVYTDASPVFAEKAA